MRVGLNINNFLTPLIYEIMGLQHSHAMIKADIHIEDIIVDDNILSPLGIIINELISNSMKHAFSGKDKGKIIISVTKKDNFITLSYSDNGRGLPESFSIEGSDTFGMQLIDMLTKQIKGTLKIDKGDGVRFVIEFSL